MRGIFITQNTNKSLFFIKIGVQTVVKNLKTGYNYRSI